MLVQQFWGLIPTFRIFIVDLLNPGIYSSLISHNVVYLFQWKEYTEGVKVVRGKSKRTPRTLVGRRINATTSTLYLHPHREPSYPPTHTHTHTYL